MIFADPSVFASIIVKDEFYDAARDKQPSCKRFVEACENGKNTCRIFGEGGADGETDKNLESFSE